jgi:hypothetical protein
MAFSFFKKNTHKAQKQETNEAADQQQTVNQVVMVPLGRDDQGTRAAPAHRPAGI